MERRTTAWVIAAAAVVFVLALGGGIAAYVLLGRDDGAPASTTTASATTLQQQQTTASNTGAPSAPEPHTAQPAANTGGQPGSSAGTGGGPAPQPPNPSGTGSSTGGSANLGGTNTTTSAGAAANAFQQHGKLPATNSSSVSSTLGGSSTQQQSTGGSAQVSQNGNAASSQAQPDLSTDKKTWWQNNFTVPVGSITAYLQARSADLKSTVDWGARMVTNISSYLPSIRRTPAEAGESIDDDDSSDSEDTYTEVPSTQASSFLPNFGFFSFKKNETATTASSAPQPPQPKQADNTPAVEPPRQSTLGWLFSFSLGGSKPETVKITHDNVLGMRSAVLSFRDWAGAEPLASERKTITETLEKLEDMELVAAFEATKLFDKAAPAKFAAQVITVGELTAPSKLALLACLPVESLVQIPGHPPQFEVEKSRLAAAREILENAGVALPKPKPKPDGLFGSIFGKLSGQSPSDTTANSTVNPTPKPPAKPEEKPAQQQTQTGEGTSTTGGMFSFLGFGGQGSTASNVSEPKILTQTDAHQNKGTDDTSASLNTTSSAPLPSGDKIDVPNVASWAGVNPLSSDKPKIQGTLEGLQAPDYAIVEAAATAFRDNVSSKVPATKKPDYSNYTEHVRAFVEAISRTSLDDDGQANLVACLPADCLKLFSTVSCKGTRLKAANDVLDKI